MHEAALQKSPCVLHGQPFCFVLKRDRNTGPVSFIFMPASYKTCPPCPAGVVYSLLIGPKTIGLTALTLSPAHAPNRETLLLTLSIVSKRHIALTKHIPFIYLRVHYLSRCYVTRLLHKYSLTFGCRNRPVCALFLLGKFKVSSIICVSGALIKPN